MAKCDRFIDCFTISFVNVQNKIFRSIEGKSPRDRRKLLRPVADESVKDHDQKFKADSRPLSKRDIHFFSRKKRERSQKETKEKKNDIHNC